MARWSGDELGRAQMAAMLWAVRKLNELFPAAVVLVRTHPADDEYSVAAVEIGDPAVCQSLAEEYLDSVPVDADESDTEDDDE